MPGRKVVKMARTVKGGSLEKRLKRRKSSLGKARAGTASSKSIRVASESVAGLLNKDNKVGWTSTSYRLPAE